MLCNVDKHTHMFNALLNTRRLFETGFKSGYGIQLFMYKCTHVYLGVPPKWLSFALPCSCLPLISHSPVTVYTGTPVPVPSLPLPLGGERRGGEGRDLERAGPETHIDIQCTVQVHCKWHNITTTCARPIPILWVSEIHSNTTFIRCSIIHVCIRDSFPYY